MNLLKKLLFTLLLASLTAQASITVRDKAELGQPWNFIFNGGCESGTSGFAAYSDTQTATMTIASPAVVTITSTTGWYVGMPIAFTTTGALPTGVTSGTTYYITSIDSGTTFKFSASRGGSNVNTSGSQSGTHTARPLVPVTGTGGTATGVTLASSTSSPLAGSVSCKITQTNSTVIAGRGVSYNFTIANAYQAQPISVQFDFNADSNFSPADGITVPGSGGAGDSDIEVFVYDVTNSTWLPVSPQVITANGSNNYTFKGIFQASYNSTSYRLAFHSAKTSAAATGYVFKFDSIYVGPQRLLQGVPTTDMAEYTMTITGTTSNPSLGTVVYNKAYSGRIGDNLKILYTLNTSTNGSAGSGTYLFNLPPGLTIDTNKVRISSNTEQGIVGAASIYSSFGTETGATGYVKVYDSTHLGLVAGDPTNEPALVGSGYYGLGNQVTYSFEALVPIQGWSSSVQMSNDAETRVVAVNGITRINTSTQTLTAGSEAVLNWTTATNDNTGSFDTTNDWFTAPVSGTYQFIGNVLVGAGATAPSEVYIRIRDDNTSGTIRYLSYSTDLSNSKFTNFPINAQIAMTAGQKVVFTGLCVTQNCSAPYSENNTIQYSSVNIYRLSGPTTLATPDNVAARAYLSANQTGFNPNGSYVKVNLDSTTLNTTGAYSTSGYKFTVPISGAYFIDANVNFASTNVLNNRYAAAIYKNGSQLQLVGDQYPAANTLFSLHNSGIFRFLAGDYIELYVYGAGNNSASTLTVLSGDYNTSLNIYRVGN